MKNYSVFYGLSKGFAALKLKFASGKANLPEAVGTVDDVIEGAGAPATGKVLSNGHSLDDMAELYAKNVNANNKWSWMTFQMHEDYLRQI